MGFKIISLALFRGASEAVGHFRMKLNISFPATGCQKLIEVDDERKLRPFYEKRMATEVAADALGEEWKVKVDCRVELLALFKRGGKRYW